MTRDDGLGGILLHGRISEPRNEFRNNPQIFTKLGISMTGTWRVSDTSVT
jgi:hypothetical protein